MKVPRVDAFDPKAVQKLGTPMDNLPRIESPEETAAAAAVATAAPVKPKREKREASIVTPVADTSEPPLVKSVEKQEILQERKKERKIARNLAMDPGYLELKALVTTSFRYPQELLDRLEDVQHQIRRLGHKKVTKNAILIVALATVLQDYEENGAASSLVRILSGQKVE